MMRAILALFILAFGCGGAAAQDVAAHGIAGKFVGAWKLIAEEGTRPDGTAVALKHPFTEGLIVYTAGGRMTVQLARAARPQFAAEEPTAPEALAAFDAYTAYYGPFTIDEAKGTITHHRENALNPGSPVKPYIVGVTRKYGFAGNRMMLSAPPITVDGEKVISTLVWERVE